MNHETIIAFLKDKMSVELHFQKWEYHGISNTLTVCIKMGDEVICESECRIEPDLGRDD